MMSAAPTSICMHSECIVSTRQFECGCQHHSSLFNSTELHLNSFDSLSANRLQDYMSNVHWASLWVIWLSYLLLAYWFFFSFKIGICFQITGIRMNVIFTGCNLQVKDPFKTPMNDAQKMKMIDSNGYEWKLNSHATFHVMNNFFFRGGIHCNQHVQWLVIQCSNKIWYEQFASTK